jgi:hypothetical protein
MRVLFFFIVLTTVILGCSHRDPNPIDRVMDEVSHEQVVSYAFNPIKLPNSATPQQLITALSKRSAPELGYFDFTSYKILQIRPVQTTPPFEKFTAVLLDTNLGQKVVLFRPMGNGTNSIGWYYRRFDAD